MCQSVALAAAHRKVGNLAQARDADMEVSGARSWCEVNVRVPAPKVRKVQKTREPEVTPDPPPDSDEPPDEGGAAARPGAFCSPAGATGTYRGRVYTCKGPGKPRWRR
ncbi:hypothetical protein ACSNOI_37190 [Actinomadura kijaniata]|uniref:hypothetical protein n=1 Tax=Actinomadura kijaniata TaxID=46161 RepID=UPI003F1DEB89